MTCEDVEPEDTMELRARAVIDRVDATWAIKPMLSDALLQCLWHEIAREIEDAVDQATTDCIRGLA